MDFEKRSESGGGKFDRVSLSNLRRQISGILFAMVSDIMRVLS